MLDVRKLSRQLVLFLLVAFALPSFAAHRKFLMWKVTSGGATVYLVGSIHLADPSIYPLPAPVEKAFADAKVLAVEADVSNFNLEEGIGMLGQYGMYGDDDSLSEAERAMARGQRLRAEPRHRHEQQSPHQRPPFCGQGPA